jgi:predicted permease
MNGLLQDLNYGSRVLRKNLGFTILAVVTIGLGIAAIVTVFSFVDALFLRSVPAKDPAGLVRILAPEDGGEGLFSIPEYAYLRQHAKSLQIAAHYSTAPLYISANGETGEVEGAVVSSNYFSLLNLKPRLGRFFTPAEDSVPGHDAVAVLGYGLWRNMYGGDPEVLGKAVVINGHSFSIIGVMPQNFEGVEIGGVPDQIWIPHMMFRVGYRWCDGFQPGCTVLSLIGRLGPGKSMPEARAEIATLMQQLQASDARFDRRLGVSVTPAIGISENRQYFASLSRLLAAIGGLVLLIVCANLEGLLVARGIARRSEIAMRLALGAGAGRIVRQLLAESLLLAGAGGVLGLLISLWTSRLLIGFYAEDSEGYRHLFNIRPDARVILFSLVVTAITGILFGLLPAFQARHTALSDLSQGGGTVSGSSRKRSRMAFVGVQIAISLALLVGAGLLARSAAQIESGENMDVHHVVGLRLRPRLVGYSPLKAQAFEREVLRRIRELPGVQSASLAKGIGLIWKSNGQMRLALPGHAYLDESHEPSVSDLEISPNYFATLRIPFVAGHDFDDHDSEASPPVAIVNETLANQVSATELPLGHNIILNDKPYRIVGVVKDAQLRKAFEAPIPVAYVDYWQNPGEVDARICVRVAGESVAAIATIRKAITSIDPQVPITETMSLIDQVRAVYTDARVASAVLNCAALLGLLLGTIGLYGVVSYEVSRRRQEIGVRVALGANPEDVIRLFLLEGLSVAVIGGISGAALAMLTARLLRAWLIGVNPSDPLVFVSAFIVLLGSVFCATYIPARRAARIDPMTALRYE